MKNGGKDLGELTNETDEYKGFYKEIIILGNKFYALKNKKLKKKKLRIILKAKGINIKAKYNKKRIDEKLKKNDEKKGTIIYEELNNFDGKLKVDFNDYKKMAEGYKLRCDNMTFISGTNNIIYKNQKLKKIENNKTFKMYYDKNEVEEKTNLIKIKKIKKN